MQEKSSKSNWLLKTKKVAVLIMVCLMIIGMLSACSKEGGDSKDASNENQNGSTNKVDGKDTKDNNDEKGQAKEKLTIAIQTYNYITDYDDNYLTRRLEEELGIDIDFYLLSADSAEVRTQLSLQVASGQKLPDIICTGSLAGETILDYGSKGVLLPLNDWIFDSNKAPHFNAIPSEEDKAAMIKATTAADGNIYSLAIFEPATWNMTPYRLYINEVWLNQLGLPMPKTTEDYYNVLKAFATQDPNGNGKADEIAAYGITSGTYGENITIPLMNSFIFYTGVDLTLAEDGKTVMAPFTTDEFKAGLEYMNRLCKEGLMPASVFTDDKTQFMAVLNNEEVNLVGSLSTGSLSRWNNYDTNPNGQQYTMMAPLEGPEGIAYSPFLQYTPSPIWFITSSCENPELALKLGDLFYRQDFSTIVRYGEEGVDWTADPEVLAKPEHTNAYIEAGLYDSPLLVDLTNIWAQNNNKFWRNVNPRYASIDDNNRVADGTIAYDPSVKSAAFYAMNYEYNYPAHPDHLLPSLTFTNEEATEQAMIIVNIKDYVNQSMAQFITGERSLSDWDSYKKELNFHQSLKTH